jgi:hypothetical protein
MTISRKFITPLVLLVTASNVFAINLAQWKYQSDVTIESGPQEYCVLTLTPEVYNAAGNNLADIRFISPNGEQISYVIAKEQDITNRENYNPAIINHSTDSAGNAVITLDFGGQTIKNTIDVKTSGNNFRRAVKVEGSNDNVQFFTVVNKAYLFAVDNNRQHRFDRIDLPSNDYRYLRITVSPMAGEEEQLTINAATAFRVDRKIAQRQSVEMLQTEHREDEKTSSSIYVYDLHYCNLPIMEIEMDIEDASFHRYVVIEGRDAATRKIIINGEDNRQRFSEVEADWNMVTCGTIYRYTDSAGQRHERLAVPVPADAAYRYLKIVIRNYDDKAIMIKSALAKMIPHKVVFPAPAAGTVKLYVGCESAASPIYDLARRLTNPLQVSAKTAAISTLGDNPLFGKPGKGKIPWTEQHKILLPAILAVVVLVLASFIFKSLKSIKSNSGQD